MIPRGTRRITLKIVVSAVVDPAVLGIDGNVSVDPRLIRYPPVAGGRRRENIVALNRGRVCGGSGDAPRCPRDDVVSYDIGRSRGALYPENGDVDRVVLD